MFRTPTEKRVAFCVERVFDVQNLIQSQSNFVVPNFNLSQYKWLNDSGTFQSTAYHIGNIVHLEVSPFMLLLYQQVFMPNFDESGLQILTGFRSAKLINLNIDCERMCDYTSLGGILSCAFLPQLNGHKNMHLSNRGLTCEQSTLYPFHSTGRDKCNISFNVTSDFGDSNYYIRVMDAFGLLLINSQLPVPTKVIKARSESIRIHMKGTMLLTTQMPGAQLKYYAPIKMPSAYLTYRSLQFKPIQQRLKVPFTKAGTHTYNNGTLTATEWVYKPPVKTPLAELEEGELLDYEVL